MDKTDNTALHSKAVQNFKDYEEATRASREEAELHRDYFDGEQWTAEEIAVLKERKQPVITDNMIKDKVEYLCGLDITARTDPKAYPRTPQHENDAEAVTDALRFVGENNDTDTKISDAFENMAVEGTGGLEIIWNADKGEIEILRNRWDRSYYDPYSREKDFSDATFLGTSVWKDIEDAKREHPDSEQLFTPDTDGQDDETHGDKPSDVWYSTDRKRVRILEQYLLWKGQWHYIQFTKTGTITEMVSTYLDEDGEPEHPYSWESAYVDRHGNRYSLIRRFKSLQDEVNHRRSKALHLLNSKQVIAEDGSVDDPKKARKEINKADGWVTVNPGYSLDVRDNIELSLGQAQLLSQAQEALSVSKPQAVSNTAASASGRSKQIDQQIDSIEIGRLFDQVRHMKRGMYRKVWNRVRQYWTDERWVRVRDDEGAPKFVQLNAPLTAAEVMEEGTQDQETAQKAQMAIQMGAPDAVIGTRNHVANLDVDIILDESPDVVNLQAEQFAGLVSLAQAGVVFPPDTYLQASNLRNKDQLIEKLKGGEDPQAQQQIQQQQELETAAAAAAIRKDNAKAARDEAEAQQTTIENTVGQAAAVGMAQQ